MPRPSSITFVDIIYDILFLALLLLEEARSFSFVRLIKKSPLGCSMIIEISDNYILYTGLLRFLLLQFFWKETKETVTLTDELRLSLI